MCHVLPTLSRDRWLQISRQVVNLFAHATLKINLLMSNQQGHELLHVKQSSSMSTRMSLTKVESQISSRVPSSAEDAAATHHLKQEIVLPQCSEMTPGKTLFQTKS